MELPETNRKDRVLVMAMYAHIEGYPPSLNALYHLAPRFERVFLIIRNVMRSKWEYPPNVTIIATGDFVPDEAVGSVPMIKKIGDYLRFANALKRVVRTHKPAVVLLYDMVAFSIFNLFLRKEAASQNNFTWYHNHDVAIENELGKYSIMRMLKKAELKYFREVSLFSLPNRVRMQYFPVNELKRETAIIPNFPSRSFFGRWKASSPGDRVLKLIFQGYASPANSLDAVVAMLNRPVGGRRLELHIAGIISSQYQNALAVLAKEKGVEDRVIFYGRLPYSELPALTSSCHVGLALYGNHNTMVRTMSTASNKIFEYASVGLPVIVNRRNEVADEFATFNWIRPSYLDEESLLQCIVDIAENYEQYSVSARMDFEKTLNFEAYFLPLVDRLETESWARNPS